MISCTFWRSRKKFVEFDHQNYLVALSHRNLNFSFRVISKWQKQLENSTGHSSRLCHWQDKDLNYTINDYYERPHSALVTTPTCRFNSFTKWVRKLKLNRRSSTVFLWYWLLMEHLNFLDRRSSNIYSFIVIWIIMQHLIRVNMILSSLLWNITNCSGRGTGTWLEVYSP